MLKALFGPKKIRQKESQKEKNKKEEVLGEIHFISLVWREKIEKKIQGKKFQ